MPETFRTLARDVGGRITVEQVADDLSALADSVLRITTQWCWNRLKNRHREVPQFGIIGYGKLGGKELGYGSDLDIVFVFDDDDERAPRSMPPLCASSSTGSPSKPARATCSRSTPRCAQRQLGPAGDQL